MEFEELLDKLFIVNCFNLFEVIPNNSIDLIVTDPPYNANQGYPNDNLPKKEYLHFTEDWIKLCTEKLKKTGSFYCFINEDYLFEYRKIFDKYLIFRRLIIWNFEASYRGFSKNYDKRCEFILFYTKSNDYTFNKLLEPPSKSTVKRLAKYADKDGNVSYDKLSPAHKKRYKRENYEKNPRNIFRGAPQGNVFNITRCIHPNNKEIKYGRHPSQKPEETIEKIIKISSNENDVILDPFVGSGTTCIVAKKSNRRFIGSDCESEFIDLAEQRLFDSRILNSLSEVKQKRMF